jgi:methionine sulfoxide reductase heme-binding subunit
MALALRCAAFLLCLVPFAYVLYGALAGSLGPDPAEAIMHITGEWAVRLLLLTLLVTPLRRWSGWRWVFKLRRMLGLYTFFYAVVHLLSFLHFYLGWESQVLLEELAERPYIAVGFGAWLCLAPLALTSTVAMQRRLGRYWRKLHQLIYPASILVCLHIIWQIRSDAGTAIIYSVLFAALLGWRLKGYLQKRWLGPDARNFPDAAR